MQDYPAPSLALAQPPADVPAGEKLPLAAVALGLLALLAAAADADPGRARLSLYLALALVSGGALGWAWLAFGSRPAGWHPHDLWRRASTSRGAVAWATGVALTGFYVVLYWFPGLLTNLIRALDPFSEWLRRKPADQWFLYGTFYTLAVLIMGGRALWKYRFARYHLARTASVMFFQLGFGFLLPGLLLALQQPEYYFSYFWPLKYDYLFPDTIGKLLHGGGLGVFMVFWGVVLSFLAKPVLT